MRQQAIIETLGCTPVEAVQVKAIIVQDVLHSSIIDWQDRQMITEAARQAWDLMTIVYSGQFCQECCSELSSGHVSWCSQLTTAICSGNATQADSAAA